MTKATHFPLDFAGTDVVHRMLRPDGYGYFLKSDAPYIFVEHSAETNGVPGYGGGVTAPQITADPRRRLVVQDVRFDRVPGTLRGWSSAGHPTNHAKTHQVEWVSWSSKAGADKYGGLWVGDWTEEHHKWAASILMWGHEEWGWPLRQWPVEPGNFVRVMPYEAWWPGRLAAGWGICQHRTAPDGSSHYDCGFLDVDRHVEYAAHGIGEGLEIGEMFCKMGDTSETVRYWQGVLAEMALLQWSDTDGIYGPVTRDAVAGVRGVAPRDNGEKIDWRVSRLIERERIKLWVEPVSAPVPVSHKHSFTIPEATITIPEVQAETEET